MNKKQYTITCTEEQLRLIARAVEDYTRFLCGQCEMNNACLTRDTNYEEVREMAALAHQIMTPELPKNASYSWNGGDCPNQLQRKEMAMGYGIYREILHYFAMQVKCDGYNVYKSETLTCKEQGPLIKIKEQ